MSGRVLILRSVAPLLCATIFAACGGRSISLPPVAPGSGASAASAVRTTSALSPPGGTLFVANADRVNAIPLAGDGTPGAPSPVASGFYQRATRGAAGMAIQAIGAGAGASVDVLAQSSGAGAGCVLHVYVPGGAGGYTDGGTPPCSGGRGLSVAGRPSGAIDYVVQAGAGDTLERYRADGSTVARGSVGGASAPRYLAEDQFSNAFVTAPSPSRFEEYPDSGVGIAGVTRSVTVKGTPTGIAVAPGGTVYVGASCTCGQSYVYAFAPSDTAPSRTIGPLPNVTALAVDTRGLLYAAVTDSGGQAANVRVYAADANGAATPVRVIATPIAYDGSTPANIVGLAIAPPAIPQGTLYVAGLDRIAAFPLSADGSGSTPDRTITGDFFVPGGPNRHGDPQRGLAAISVGPNGTVAALQRRTDDPAPLLQTCGLYVWAANANGNATPLQTPPCAGEDAVGISARPSGAIDYLTDATGGPPDDNQNDLVHRFRADGVTLTRVAFAPGYQTHVAFTEDAASNVYVAATAPNRVEVFPADGFTVSSSPSRQIPLDLIPTAIALAGDGTIYVGVRTTDYTAYYIRAYAPDATVTASRTIGPFPNMVKALVVDEIGELYVGLNGGTTVTNRVRVYASDANGEATPLRSILSPIPESTGYAAFIQSLAIAPGAAVTTR